MRRGVLVIAALIVCGANRVETQPAGVPAAKSHLRALLGDHGPGRPAPENRQSTPDVLFDATNLGSPVVLDKNWRVGITANQNAANPDFDDSSWAL